MTRPMRSRELTTTYQTLVDMGSGLELVRMTFYVFFPVGLFYYFNRPSFYQKLLEEKKDVFYPDGNHPPLTLEGNRAEFERLREERRKSQQQTNPPGVT